MDTRLWTGIAIGVAGVLLVGGFLVVATAATTAGPGMMMGMMGAEDMAVMHARCHEMMEEHEDGAGQDDTTTAAGERRPAPLLETPAAAFLSPG